MAAAAANANRLRASSLFQQICAGFEAKDGGFSDGELVSFEYSNGLVKICICTRTAGPYVQKYEQQWKVNQFAYSNGFLTIVLDLAK
jgi:hypothetical protein